MQPTPRLTRRIRADFDAEDVDLVIGALGELAVPSAPRTGERVQAAIVKLSRGDLGRFDRALEGARRDWRDVLVAAGFEHEDWAQRLDEYLGPMGASA